VVPTRPGQRSITPHVLTNPKLNRRQAGQISRRTTAVRPGEMASHGFQSPGDPICAVCVTGIRVEWECAGVGAVAGGLMLPEGLPSGWGARCGRRRRGLARTPALPGPPWAVAIAWTTDSPSPLPPPEIVGPRRLAVIAGIRRAVSSARVLYGPGAGNWVEELACMANQGGERRLAGTGSGMKPSSLGSDGPSRSYRVAAGRLAQWRRWTTRHAGSRCAVASPWSM
jgi:hypothetical protein